MNTGGGEGRGGVEELEHPRRRATLERSCLRDNRSEATIEATILIFIVEPRLLVTRGVLVYWLGPRGFQRRTWQNDQSGLCESNTWRHALLYRQEASRVGAASPTLSCYLYRPVTLGFPLSKNSADRDRAKRWVRHTNLRLCQTTGTHVAVIA